MGIPVNTVFEIIEKVKAWVVGRVNDSQEQLDSDISHSMCCECKTQLMDFSIKGVSVVKSDGRGNTNKGEQLMKLCKYCEHNRKFDRSASGKLRSDNIKSFQSDHLLRFLEANRLSTNSSVASSADDLSPYSFTRSSSRSDDEEDVEDSGKHFLGLSSGYYRGISEIDSCSVSDRHEFLSVKSVGSSPFDSPSRITPRSGSSVHLEQEGSPVSLNDASLRQERLANLKRPETECDDNETTDYGSDDLSVFRDQYAEVKQPFDFESNGLVWLPPPPDDADDETENSFFEYDDEDDDVGESGMIFRKSNISSDIFPTKVKSNEEQKKPLRAVVHGHFRALVLQLLQGEDIYVENEDEGQGWLNIVTSLAWQAANFVKPDTRSGGSMDPGNYVKIKCIESGSPSESTFIKGVVCTKNIKHKRMTSQYRNPRLFLLGGALEYQRASNQLASFDTLLQQEIDHLKLIVSKIEAHRPNVLLVEKSVSSYAQEYLLAKDISLVLNVKRSLLERVARCTGAHIVPSMDKISSARLGNCEVFRLERIVEECSVAHLPNKKSTKTLMFFEGCPRRLGCTVLLRGAHSELLKKVKRVMHYAVFAAYHLSLETSFLADEGATLLKMPLISPVSCPEGLMNLDVGKSMISNQSIQDELSTVEGQCEDLCECRLSITSSFDAILDVSASNDRSVRFTADDVNTGSSYLSYSSDCVRPSHTVSMESRNVNAYLHASNTDLVSNVAQGTCHHFSRLFSNHELAERSVLEEEESVVRHQSESTYGNELTRNEGVEANGVISEYLTVDNHPSILVSFSSHCVLKGTLCERSQLLRIKFYSSFDKPLGRYLQDDLFDQTAYCQSCKESTDAHVRRYIHQQGSLSINVRRLFKLELPGKHEGKIWMWHRCLKCAHIDGVPPANRRVLMSYAAWGLSFGKFLELSFSNHATANRVASCGHSLQRDCLRFFGYGSMVAFFRYSPIDILSVRLPPSMLEFDGQVQQEWVKIEAVKLYHEMEVLYAEVFDALQSIEEKSSSLGHANLDESGFHNHITDLKALLKKERNEYKTLLHPAGTEDPHYWEDTLDILELNRLRRCLLMDSYIWDHRLYSLESLSKNKALIQRIDPHLMEVGTYDKLKQWRDESFFKNTKLSYAPEENRMAWTVSENPKNHLMSEGKEEHCFSIMDSISKELTEEQLIKKSVESYYGSNTELASDPRHDHGDFIVDYEVPVDERSLGSIPSPASYLSDKFDSVWTGTAQHLTKPPDTHFSQPENKQFGTVSVIDLLDNRSRRLLKSPMRVHSFDSAMTIQEKIRQGLSPSLQMSSLRSFHASGEFSSMIRDPVPSILRTLSQTSSREAQKLSFIFHSRPLIISSASNFAREGVRLLLPQTGHKNIVVPVCDDEPTSAVSYVLCSKEYEDWITDKLVDHGVSKASESNTEDELNLPGSATSTLSAFHSFASLESEDTFFRSHLSNDSSAAITSMFSDQKKSPHFSTTFEDEYSSSQGKAKFSVICYYGRQFDTLRKMCCPSEVDFIRSLSRCSRWNAQGGKSNVYFAKSLDERFIVKQVTKTELDSFEEFAPQYFKYLMDSLSTGSPTCLAKVLGIYQVTVKHPKSGKQTKMDLMVMENLFFRRNISRVYDLKGSARSRYNADPTGKDKVLLDMNLLETLRTQPIFLGSKAKRSLERAVWNDTSFLASIDVMDYSLLVGVDDEGKELVLGIIDFMRQYTWDKHLETWVKASGILGGPKNTSPTVVSPMQYKKRFRKAMTTYFLTVPDQWSL